MKMTKNQIEAHCFYLVEDGFQVLSPNNVMEFLTVSEHEAVKINDLIYCTREWYDSLFKKING